VLILLMKSMCSSGDQVGMIMWGSPLDSRQSNLGLRVQGSKTRPSRNRSSSSPTDKTLMKIAHTLRPGAEYRLSKSEWKEGTDVAQAEERTRHYFVLGYHASGHRRSLCICPIILRLLHHRCHRRYQKPVYDRAGYWIRHSRINVNQKSRGHSKYIHVNFYPGPRNTSTRLLYIQSPSKLKQPSRRLSFVFLQRLEERTNCSCCLIPGITAVLVEQWPLDDDASESHSFIVHEMQCTP
jgi:hypothetical protein